MNQLFSVSRRAGDLLFLSGHCGIDETGNLVAGGIGPEARQTLMNISDTLESVHLSLANVVSINCYVTDITNRAAMDTAYAAAFVHFPLPTRTTVEVAALAAGLSVEMTAVAVFESHDQAHILRSGSKA